MVMESLMRRMKLPREECNKYASWVKGYEGELQFDKLTAKLQCECIILNDLFLQVNGKKFQIDSVVITSKGIHVYEVKNYSGVYYYENEKMYHGRTRKEIYDPLHQISHANSLLRQLIDKMGFNLPVKSLIIFVKPDFTLYQAPLIDEIILPTMIEAHMTKMNEISGRLNQNHHKFAQELKLMHMEDFSLQNIPYYEETLLKKGVSCSQCEAFLTQFSRSKYCVCTYCGNKELVSTAVVRQVQEFKRLFPDQKITMPLMYDWCDKQIPASRIRYILTQQLRADGFTRWRYYE